MLKGAALSQKLCLRSLPSAGRTEQNKTHVKH